MVVMYEGGYPNEISLEKMREKAPVFVKNQLTLVDFLMESITPFYQHDDNYFDFFYRNEIARYHYRRDKRLTNDVVVSNLVRFSDNCSFIPDPGDDNKTLHKNLNKAYLSSYFTHKSIEFKQSIFSSANFLRYRAFINFDLKNPFYKTTLTQRFLDNLALFFSHPKWAVDINIDMSFLLKKKASLFSFFRPSFEPTDISCTFNLFFITSFSKNSHKPLAFSYHEDTETINSLINEKINELINLSYEIDFFADKESFARYVDLFEMEAI